MQTAVHEAGIGAPGRARSQPLIAVRHSPLARRIVAINLVGIVLLVAGVLSLNPARHSLLIRHQSALASEARLVASALSADPFRHPEASPGSAARAVLPTLDLPADRSVSVFDAELQLLASRIVAPAVPQTAPRSSWITSLADRLRIATPPSAGDAPRLAAARDLAGRVLAGGHNDDGQRDTVSRFSAAARIGGGGVVVIASGGEDVERLIRSDRALLLRTVAVAIVVSVGLSVVLAATIATPLAELVSAVETGREDDARALRHGQFRIPDLSARSDEIGRLSVALRGMVAALSDRIETNERFAADVAHEIRNPLASLRSAAGSLRRVHDDASRARLLDVIDHDVRRLDRLVGDISNASRLDSELVREEEREFDLRATLSNLADHLGRTAGERGIRMIADVPPDPIRMDGLETRLAQVFVNLLDNAISFCGTGDTIRIWARRRDRRVLVVVEDTGPGIPDDALCRIFERFHSERPEAQFGDNSGLGLSISKQIVEAHGGVIWAENIASDRASGRAGARFVIGLPV